MLQLKIMLTAGCGLAGAAIGSGFLVAYVSTASTANGLEWPGGVATSLSRWFISSATSKQH